MSVAIGTAPAWRSYDPRSLQRQRWQRTASECAQDAATAGEAAIADAFRRGSDAATSGAPGG